MKKNRRQNKSAAKNGLPPPAAKILRAELSPELTRRLEWLVFAAICAATLWLNVALFRHSGAFWRDECSTILLAQSTTWLDLWNSLPTDSFPGLFVSLLRLWIFSGLGSTDAGIRLFGVLIGVGILVAAFFCCRTFSKRPPLLAAALLAVCPSTFYYGSSIRAYGLAAILAVLCLAAFWKLVQNPTKWNAAIAAALAVLNVQASYQNTYLLLGIGVAAAVVCALQRRWKLAILILAIGFLAGCTLLPYLPIVAKYRALSDIAFLDFSLETVAGRFADALAGGSGALLAIWTLLLAAAAIFACVAIHRNSSSDAAAPIFYLLLAILISGMTGFAFMRINAMPPFVWHYVPFIAMLAVGVEICLEPFAAHAWLRHAKLAAACIVLALGFFPASAMSDMRRTNVDLACRAIAAQAGARDLVLAIPHHIAPSVRYYYRGPAPWSAVPMDDYDRFSPSPEIKRLMAAPNAIEPTLQAIRRTLQAGGRVWIIRNHPEEPLTAPPKSPPPAPDPLFGWNQGYYVDAWVKQIDHLIQTRAAHVSRDLLPAENNINPLENTAAYCAKGWK